MTVIINGTNGITSVNGTAAAPSVTGTDTDTGIVYGTNTVSIATNGTERLQADASGNIGIGYTPSTMNTNYNKSLEFGGYGTLTGNTAGVETDLASNSYRGTDGNWKFKNASSNPAALVSLNDGSAQSINSYISSANGTAGNNVTWVAVTSVSRDKSFALQGASPQTGTGITFPATQSASSDANTLDDYEEGTWTPVVAGTTTTGTATYGIAIGRYTKIGRVVTAQAYVTWSGGTGTGALIITGFPFNAMNLSNLYAPVTIGQIDSVTLGANYSCSNGYMPPNNSYFLPIQQPTGGGSSATVTYDPAGGCLFSATYMTD